MDSQKGEYSQKVGQRPHIGGFNKWKSGCGITSFINFSTSLVRVYDCKHFYIVINSNIWSPLINSKVRHLSNTYYMFSIVKTSVADPDPGSGIRDWVLFDPWIRDPE